DRAVSLRHGEARLRPVNTDLRGNGEHVLELPRMQLAAKARVVAVGAVGEDRRGRDLPLGRLLAHAGGKLRLRLKADLVRDLRLAPTEIIAAPLLGQI